MYHSTDGLFFERQDNGGVRIVKHETGHRESPVVFEAVLDKDHWASIIATMSYYGEEDYGFYRASEFHSKTPIGPTTPIKDKLPLW